MEDRLDYTIIGGEVNLASRLESNAEVGQTLISHETYALIKDEILCEEKEEISVKGINHKVQTYQLTDKKKESIKDNKLLIEEYGGFSLTVDLEYSKKEQVVISLKKHKRK